MDESMRANIGSSQEANYMPRVVAFVDILGFGQAVTDAEKDADHLKQILKALQAVRSAPFHSPVAGLRTQNFSDSLILSANCTCDGLWSVLLCIKELALQLLELGLLIRGGVTIGKIHHDEQSVFGTGVNDAYRLESKVAKYPRIVLGQAAIEAACRYARELGGDAEKNRDYWLERDEDGVWHLKYLAEFGANDPANSGNGQDDRILKIGKRIQTKIQEKMDTTVENPAIFEKVRWLALTWNGTAMTRGNRGSLFEGVLFPGHTNLDSRLRLENNGKSATT